MLLRADARSIPLASGTVQTCVTSPPYWGLRDYGLNDAGIGLESTLEAYIENMVAVFREVWRVLRDNGTLWLNLGDLFWGAGGANNNSGITGRSIAKGVDKDERDGPRAYSVRWGTVGGLKPKDLVGLPWRVAFALQADGWYLRSDIIWAKPNPMPESVTDRPTKAHEYLFLMSKRARYHCDMEAIKEPAKHAGRVLDYTGDQKNNDVDPVMQATRPRGRKIVVVAGRNRRTVWTIPTQPYRGAHFATFPEKLVEPCILAGTSPKACGVCGAPWERVTDKSRTFESGSGRSGNMPSGKNGRELQGGGETLDVRRGPVVHVETTGWRPTCDHEDDRGTCLVFDPFCGSGTVGAVARRFGRRFVGLDLSAPYLKLAQERIGAETLGMAL